MHTKCLGQRLKYSPVGGFVMLYCCYDEIIIITRTVLKLTWWPHPRSLSFSCLLRVPSAPSDVLSNPWINPEFCLFGSLFICPYYNFQTIHFKEVVQNVEPINFFKAMNQNVNIKWLQTQFPLFGFPWRIRVRQYWVHIAVWQRLVWTECQLLFRQKLCSPDHQLLCHFPLSWHLPPFSHYIIGLGRVIFICCQQFRQSNGSQLCVMHTHVPRVLFW